jgi:hypothetical protein
MLLINVTLLPGGDAMAAKTIATGVIVNDETGTEERGNYFVRFQEADGAGDAHASVMEWPRLKRGVWELVHEALEAALEKGG